MKITDYGGELPQITGCPFCSGMSALWFNDKGWVVDTEDGLSGIPVNFCPNCGKVLPHMKVTKEDTWQIEFTMLTAP